MSQPNNPGSANGDLSSNAVSGASLQVVSGQGSLELSASYTPNANTTVVGSSVINRLPDEELAGLRKMEFQVLMDGDIAGARAGRDMFLGFCISGIIGLIGLVATTDWGEVFTKEKFGTAVWAAVMFAIVVASAVATVIYARRHHKVSQDSAYSALIGRLQKHFGIDPK
jgi:hypothetical protein